MRYFITLQGQSYTLKLESRDASGRAVVAHAGDRPAALQTEVLYAEARGRPALVRVDGQVFRVRLGKLEAAAESHGKAHGAPVHAVINGQTIAVQIETELERRARPIRVNSALQRTRVVAPMPGRVVKVNVAAGDDVLAGAPLLSIEAMKMENELQAPNRGRISKVLVEAGTTVEADQELIMIDPE